MRSFALLEDVKRLKSGNPEISPGGVQNEKNRKFPNFPRT